jgi:hypothetical protein
MLSKLAETDMMVEIMGKQSTGRNELPQLQKR